MKAKRRSFPETVKAGSCTVTIYEEQKPSGTYYRLAYYMGGKRQRPTFSDYDVAKAEAEAKAAQLARGDLDAAQVTGRDRLVYGRALDAVSPFGVQLDAAALEYAEARKLLGGHSLVDAARFFMRHHGEGITGKMVPDAVQAMIEEKRQAGLSQLYLNDLRYRLGGFAEQFQCAVRDLTPSDLRRFFTELKLSARSFNNYLTTISTFFAFAQDHGWLSKDADLLSRIEKRKEKAAPVQIYSPAELSKLMKHAREDLQPCIAICAFAGLRTEELLRLTWEDVRRCPGYIEVEADKAKTARRRLVPIGDALASWLAPFAQQTGPIWPHSKPYLFRCNEKASELSGVEWKPNALRHSYITYRLAETQNVNQTALEAGNSPQMVFQHYRELATPAQAKTWFSLRSTSDTGVIAMRAA